MNRKDNRTGRILAVVIGVPAQLVWWLFAPVRWIARKRK